MTEFQLIERIAALQGERASVSIGIGDDAAVLDGTPDQQWVVTTDTLVAGVHFPLDAAPSDIGFKAVAVNVSDLAAMGAEPRFATLALTLPGIDPGFVDPLLRGLADALARDRVALIGGDTTRGPLSLTVTAIGEVPRGMALTRSGARVDDRVYVSGTLGDAAAALAMRGVWPTLDEAGRLARSRLEQRLARPHPRVALGRALRGIASACIDVSDGLAQDLGHIANRSGLAAVVDSNLLPLSRALQTVIVDPDRSWPLAFGGDDYELCFCAPASASAEIERIASDLKLPLTCIGTMGPGAGVHVLDRAGRVSQAPRGYEHFRS
jgi:thiamine-monophosphate kinase